MKIKGKISAIDQMSDYKTVNVLNFNARLLDVMQISMPEIFQISHMTQNFALVTNKVCFFNIKMSAQF